MGFICIKSPLIFWQISIKDMTTILPNILSNFYITNEKSDQIWGIHEENEANNDNLSQIENKLLIFLALQNKLPLTRFKASLKILIRV